MPSPHATLKPESINYDTKVVAFLDVLGFKNLIRKAKVADQAANIICSLDYALRHHSPDAPDSCTVKMFSDCICVSAMPTEEGLDFVLWRCVVMQGLLLENGHLLRGAVTFGRHFQNDSMIFSEGLVNSYELEQSATYPRIIVSEDVARSAKEAPRSVGDLSSASNLLLEDQDGMIFLDYFRYMEFLAYIDRKNRIFRPASYQFKDPYYTEEDAVTPSEFSECHKTVVERGLKEYVDRPHVLQKYGWMAQFERRADRFQFSE